jgi:uncharacterized protein YwbE
MRDILWRMAIWTEQYDLNIKQGIEVAIVLKRDQHRSILMNGTGQD